MITETNRHARARQSRALSQIWKLLKDDPEFLERHATDEEQVVLELAARELLDPTTLEPNLRHDLEAFALRRARPSLVVRNGAVNTWATSPLWRERLTRTQATIKTVTASVGRIDARLRPSDAAPGDDCLQQIGTCFAFGPNLALTTRSVAAAFCHDDLSVREGCHPQVNFVEESGRDDDRDFAIVRCVAWDAELDYALLETARGPGFPEPLALAGGQDEVDGLGSRYDIPPVVIAVGYPGFETRTPTDVLLAAFGDHPEAKRIAPGRIRNALEYVDSHHDLIGDYSALGSQPGSPVIDLSTGLVIGLHHSGSYGTPGVSRPIWRILAALDGTLENCVTEWIPSCPPASAIPFPLPVPRPHPIPSAARRQSGSLIPHLALEVVRPFVH